MISSLPTANIFFRDDARKISPATVKALAASISEVGLINPIRVRERGDKYEVISGAHRLSAVRQMRAEEIDCIVVNDDDLHAELAMIDENLCRSELSPAERAANTARRKVVYEELHPETKHGSPGVSRQVGDTRDRVEVERFTENTAAATGQSERTVQRDAERGERVSPEALAMVRGTELDTGAYLDKLKRVSAEDQVETVRRALAGIARTAERDRQDAARRKADRHTEAEARERAAERCAEILCVALSQEILTEFRAELQATDVKTVLGKISILLREAQ